MDGGRQGWDRSVRNDGFSLNQDPSGSSGAVSRGERSPSWGRWVIERQGQRFSLEIGV